MLGIVLPPAGPDEMPTLVWGLVPREDYEVDDDWKTVGLRGTGSNTLIVADAFIPDHRCINPWEVSAGTAPGTALNDSPLFRLPFGPALAYYLSAPALGAAERTFEDWTKYIAGKRQAFTGAEVGKQAPTLIRAGELSAKLAAARMLMTETPRAIDEAILEGPLDQELRVRSGRNATYAVRLCVEVVETLHAVQRRHRPVRAPSGAAGLARRARRRRPRRLRRRQRVRDLRQPAPRAAGDAVTDAVSASEHVSVSVLGNRVVRVEDPGLLTGATPFVSDIDDPLLEGALHVTYVRSAMAHARILDVDVSDAMTQPGVVGIFTASDLGLVPQPSPYSPMFDTCPLAAGVVRYVGEPIAAVVTERADQGEDAAELVVVDYDPLPVVVDPMEALAGRDPAVPRGRHQRVRRLRDDGRPRRDRRPVRRLRGRGDASSW